MMKTLSTHVSLLSKKAKTALDLLVLADKYGMEHLKQKCELILLKNLRWFVIRNSNDGCGQASGGRRGGGSDSGGSVGAGSDEGGSGGGDGDDNGGGSGNGDGDSGNGIDAVVDIILVAERLGCGELGSRARIILQEDIDRLSEASRVKLKSNPELLLKMFELACKRPMSRNGK